VPRPLKGVLHTVSGLTYWTLATIAVTLTGAVVAAIIWAKRLNVQVK
jgi:hypothetical protein